MPAQLCVRAIHTTILATWPIRGGGDGDDDDGGGDNDDDDGEVPNLDGEAPNGAKPPLEHARVIVLDPSPAIFWFPL